MDGHRVFLALGSNLGDRAGNLRAAVELLGRRMRIIAVSHWLETEPVGGPAGQGAYLNGALAAQAEHSAQAVLGFCLEIEAQLGRVRDGRTVPWSARTLDLDLLLYDDAVINRPPELIVPHPRMTGRRFVLQPLCEIAPELSHPVQRKTIRELLTGLA